MARLRLSTGILSPLQSDISINDTSAFSFGSLTGTPEFEKEFESSQSKHVTKELDFNMCCSNSTPENATEFDMMMRDFKKEVNINAEKEEKFRSTYEQLKQSFDELLHKKLPDLSILSPISKNEDLENIGKTKSVDFDKKVEKTKENVQNSQDEEEAYFLPTAELQYWPHATVSKVAKSSVENSSTCKRERNYRQLKNTSNQKESEKKLSSKIRSETNSGNELNSRKEEVSHRTKSSKVVSSSTQTCESLLQATSAVSGKGQSTISTIKAKSSSDLQNMENKGMSIEKSIQIAVSMELDKIRSLMLDQKLSLGKEMLKLQEMTRKQSEVMNYLLTVIEELLERNAKLRANHK